MQHEFKFRIKQEVFATDYDNPPKKHAGIITRRWLEEPRPDLSKQHFSLGSTLEEHYDVLVMLEVGKGKKKTQKPQSCEFLAKDLEPAPRI